MLPYTPRKKILSFTDKKWDWRYPIKQDGSINDKNPVLYELLPSGAIKKSLCKLDETAQMNFVLIKLLLYKKLNTSNKFFKYKCLTF